MPAAQSKNKKSTDDILIFFFFFFFFSDLFQETGFDISCKLSQTVCMKYKILFPGEKIIIKLLSVEFALSVVTVKLETIF